MTVHTETGRGKVPLWAAVTVVLSILIAVAGIAYGWVQKSADVEHKLLGQKIQIVADQQKSDEDLIVGAVGGVADVKSELKAIKEQTKYIPQILRILMQRGQTP